jgi:hypothetical protein
MHDLVTVQSTSTLWVSQPPPTGESSRGGLSLSDKIALGVGIGFGLPATIAALLTCCFEMRRS